MTLTTPGHTPVPHAPVLRLTIFIGSDDRWHGKPLHTEIMHRALEAGLAGASAFKGVEGFGASGRIHTNGIWRVDRDNPIVLVIIDTEDRVQAFLPQLDELISEGLAILDPVEIVPTAGQVYPAAKVGRQRPGTHPGAGL